MPDITPEELGNGFKVVGVIAGIVISILLAGWSILRVFVTRYEYNKLVELVESLKKLQDEMKSMQGKMSPEAESQMIKILQKVEEHFSGKERRK